MSDNNSIKFVTDFVKNASTLDDKLDALIDPFKDYSDTLGELIYPVKLTLSVLTIARRHKFKKFIKEFSKLVEEDVIHDEYIEKLGRFLRKEENLEYISEIIDSSVESKSSKCSAIMGYYAGTILKKLRDIEYKDMIILNALKIMNNLDLDYFVLLYDRFSEREIVNYSGSLLLNDLLKEIGNVQITIFQIENTVEKLKNIQILGYAQSSWFSSGNAWGSFRFNENSSYLYEIIKKSKVRQIVDSE